MHGRRAAISVAAVLVALLLASVATAEPAQILGRTTVDGWQFDVQSPVDEPEGFVPNEPAPVAPAETISVAEATRMTAAVLQGLGILTILIVTLLILRSRWAERDAGVGTDDDDPAGLTTLAEVADAIVADAELHRAALAHGPPRDGIVACWVRLEASVEAAGVDRDPALTSSELTVEVVHRFPVDPRPIERLAALYREARFSSHVLDEADRLDAEEALTAVHAGLRTASGRNAVSRSGSEPVS